MGYHFIYAGFLAALCSQCTFKLPTVTCSSTGLISEISTIIVEDKVKFYLFTKAGYRYQFSKATDMKTLGFDPSKKTVILIHGLMNDIQSNVEQHIGYALLQFQQVNVIGVDWSPIAYTWAVFYPTVLILTQGVGRIVGDMVVHLIEHYGLSGSNVHFVGHSLGAHVSGRAGKELMLYNHRAGRISGLDPAAPLIRWDVFNLLDLALDRDAADFVDCIHTSRLFGTTLPVCHADFTPDYNKSADGCDTSSCHHSLSHEFFASSINPENTFEAISDDGKHSRMGYYADPTVRGIFRLNVSTSYPYSMDHHR